MSPAETWTSRISCRCLDTSPAVSETRVSGACGGAGGGGGGGTTAVTIGCGSLACPDDRVCTCVAEANAQPELSGSACRY